MLEKVEYDESLDDALTAAQSGAELTRRLLGLSRKQAQDVEKTLH